MSNAEEKTFWRKCSTCKAPIPWGGKYYVCSVSTCNGQRTGYVFCRMECFESHVPGARHRDAGAIAMTAPLVADAASVAAERTPVRRIVTTGGGGAGPSGTPISAAKGAAPTEVLIIASRLKDYIQARAGMNTSAAVMDILSQHLRVIADRAIDHARGEGRKTVLDRDFAFLKDSR